MKVLRVLKKALKVIGKIIEWFYDMPLNMWKYSRRIDDEEIKSYYREEYILRKK